MPNNNDFVIKNGVLKKYTGKGENVVTIPNSVTEIGKSAFDGCSSLKNIVIPNSVTTIGKNIFKGCSNLKEVKASGKLSDKVKDTLRKELGNKVEFIDSNEKK